MTEDFLRLMLVTNRVGHNINKYIKFLETCAESGVSSVQLREKEADYDTLLRFAELLQKVLDKHKIPLIINDRVDIAKKIGASGVHIGQKDGDPRLIRKILGPDRIIGLSVGSSEELDAANGFPVDYIGVGAVFETKTKKDVSQIIGISGLRALNMNSLHKVVAIGGITEHNIRQVVATGVSGVAVVGAIHDSCDPKSTIYKLLNLMGKKQ